MISNKFTRDINILKTNVCWVIFRFQDSSIKMIKTTLVEKFLEDIKPEENSLYDFQTHSWFNLKCVRETKIEIYKEEPELREVDLFANKFIK